MENTTNQDLLAKARSEILRSWRRICSDNADHPRALELFNPDQLPAFHDPFAGGGALPLEAQRLGLEAYASDLNPVAVLINKAMIEIPPKFTGDPPVNPEARSGRELVTRQWKGAQGLAEDVRYYGRWMREEAQRRIGHLYPEIEVTPEIVKERSDLRPYVGRKRTVIAWLWARTVRSPNPAFRDVEVPLASTWMLSTKNGKEAYVEPVIEGRGYRFRVRVGSPPDLRSAKAGTSAGRRKAFRCLMSDAPVPYDYIRSEGRAGRMGARLMAIVAEGNRCRLYLNPTDRQSALAVGARSAWKPEIRLEGKTRVNVSNYGLDTFGDLFTPRQLVALTTFSDLVGAATERVRRDAVAASLSDDDVPLRDGGTGARAYAEAVAVYLAFAVSKVANVGSAIASWMSDRGAFRETFARQAIPMVWDYAEANPFARAGGSLATTLDKGARVIDALPSRGIGSGQQLDAATHAMGVGKVVSTDPPYYDNIGYADLSDFFYVWLRPVVEANLPRSVRYDGRAESRQSLSPHRTATKTKTRRRLFSLRG